MLFTVGRSGFQKIPLQAKPTADTTVSWSPRLETDAAGTMQIYKYSIESEIWYHLVTKKYLWKAKSAGMGFVYFFKTGFIF